jgi:peptide/nickel transport system substrate-binding protein
MMNTDFFTVVVSQNIYEPLFRYEFGRFIPVIADYWYFASDSLIVIRYKDKIRFSDGSEMTANDVALSLYRATTTPRFEGKIHINEIAFPQKGILELHYDPHKSVVDISHFLPYVFVYKADYINNPAPDYLKFNPLGTGEHKLVKATDDMITLSKNRYHRNFKANRRVPDNAIYHFVPEFSDQFDLLRRGEINMMLDLCFEDYHEAMSLSHIKVIDRTSHYTVYMPLDAMSEISPSIDRYSNPLRDKRVRQAMAHAIDTRNYINHDLHGKAHLLPVPAHISSMYFPMDMQYYEYDLSLARELLAEAGYGRGFTMTLASTKGLYSHGLAEFVKKSLADINIMVNTEYYDGMDLYREIENIRPGAYIRVTSTRELAVPFSIRIMNLFYPHEGSTSSSSQFVYRLPRITDILDQIRELNEYDRNQYLFHRALAEAVFDETLVIPFFQPYQFFAMDKKITWDTSSGTPMLREIKVSK